MHWILKVSLITVLAVITIGPVAVSAQVPILYTNENFFSSQHDMPVSFERDSQGNFRGVTVSGKLFRQTAIVSDLHVHLQRFEIDEAHFYISSFGVIAASTDTVALSIYLSRANWS